MKNYRYLVDFDLNKIEYEFCDVIIIGSGIAGAYTALQLPLHYSISILTKESMDISNSSLAQGGIAVSLDKEDSPELHYKDTIYTGVGLCNEESVRVLVNEAVQNIKQLCNYGVNFDKKSSDELALTREGAHSKNRIIHSGDSTGKEVCDKLISNIRARENIYINEKVFVLDILVEDNTCKGVLVFDEKTSEYKAIFSNVVICASGGYGQLYNNTTNPDIITGDGVALAYRAGIELMDLEFVQFHPTVLFHPKSMNFLISEAVRGEGALLKNINGERFMPKYHELNELAPRDVVSRSIFNEMKNTNSECVYLDITFKEKEYLTKRFPNIYKTCMELGIDMSKDYIPVAPAQHYSMGGIRTDMFGRTSIKGFYSCGESACNGVHGANRLASNSLLEGLVFGNKINEDISDILKDSNIRDINKVSEWISNSASLEPDRQYKDFSRENIKNEIRNIMTKYVGIVREEEGLKYALEKLNEYKELIYDLKNGTIDDFELQNMILLSTLVIQSALEREESRGAHFRSDFNKTDDINWRRNIIRKKC